MNIFAGVENYPKNNSVQQIKYLEQAMIKQP